jgi:hypothetical protein
MLATAPADFLPCSWFVYKTMGPSANREYQSYLLEVGGWPKYKQNGISDSSRSSARDAIGKLKEEKRINDAKNERGLPKKEQIFFHLLR